MLVMLGSVAMMFFMPKIIVSNSALRKNRTALLKLELQANMDPKDREDFLAQQSRMMAMPAQLSQG